MNQYWKGSPIQCEILHPKSWDVAETLDYPEFIFICDAKLAENRLLETTFQTYEGNELLQSILQLWRHLDIYKQLEKSSNSNLRLYMKDCEIIASWLKIYGCPYVQIYADDTGELHVMNTKRVYFRAMKFIEDLYIITDTYKKVQNREPLYSHWPIFFHTDGHKLILRAKNLIAVAYAQMIFSSIPGNDKIKLCEHCGGPFVAQRRNARLCEDCFLHRSTTWYRENKGRKKS